MSRYQQFTLLALLVCEMSIFVQSTSPAGIVLLQARRFSDARGFFSEVYSARDCGEYGINDVFTQDNLSYSSRSGTVRGLHYQNPPYAQSKLVRVVRGRILDIVVDLRLNSPTFGQHEAYELSSSNDQLLYIPVGFAHGFCTLVDDTEVQYKVGNYYAPDHERGIYWADPDLKINWPVDISAAIVSDKDASLPCLQEISTPFVLNGDCA